MKIIEELMEAVLRAQEAQREVDRLVAEIKSKADGRRQPRKPRRKKAAKAVE